MSMFRLLLLPALVLAPTLLPVSDADAQIFAGPGAGRRPIGAGAAAATQGQSAARPPPPALPGARVDKQMVAPPERPVGDMPPNEALFDSINRGDIVTAKDALSRGADLNSRNILGMTPLDLSVDLGRNDITFLLLSLRGSEGGNRLAQRPSQPEPVAAKPPQKNERKQARVTPATAPAAPAAAAAPAAPRTPRLFAGDGGTPVPSAGFLGFDASRGTLR